MNVTVNYEEGAAEFARRLFGRSFTDEDLALATGALDSAEVTVRAEHSRLIANVTHELVFVQQRIFYRDRTGNVVIRNQVFRKKPGARRGIGIESFLNQVEGALRLGIRRIHTKGAGSPRSGDDNGYYTWARFGFDASFDEDEADFIPRKYALAGGLNDLIGMGGSEWWKANGWPKRMTFDLDPDSSSMRILNSYVDELKRQGRL